MTESISSIMRSLPEDLQPSAQRLWDNANGITDAAAETLLVSYRVLREIRGDPRLLASGRDLLVGGVVTALADASRDIDQTYPAVTATWQGGGAETFVEYIHRLSRSIQSCEDSAAGVARAVWLFRESVTALWSKVVDRTTWAADEVAVAIAEVGDQAYLAVGPVIDIVDGFADYVENLAKSLMNLTGSSHTAGAVLTAAISAQESLRDGDELRLPTMAAIAAERADWQPSGQVAMNTAALADLTSALSANGDHWNDAATHLVQVAHDHFVPDAFGLAGAHFHDDLQELLADQHKLYTTANAHMDALAARLRHIGVEYADIDDAMAAELRRGIQDR